MKNRDFFVPFWFVIILFCFTNKTLTKSFWILLNDLFVANITQQQNDKDYNPQQKHK